MNTTELINEIAQRTQQTRTRMTRQEVGLVVDLLLEVMTEELTKPDGEVRLKGVGIFAVKAAKMPGGSLRQGQSEPIMQNSSARSYRKVSFRVSHSLARRLKK